MTIINISKNTKQLLKEYSNDNLDKNLNKLITNVEDNLPIIGVDTSPMSTMRINDTTIEKLQSYKLTNGESYENIIIRMMIISQHLNNSDE